MDFINKQNCIGYRFKAFHCRLQPCFKISPVLCARKHASHVEKINARFLKQVGDFVHIYLQCKSFHKGGLADSGFSYEYDIIFSASAEHLDRPADFLLASYEWVDLTVGRLLYQINRKLC